MGNAVKVEHLRKSYKTKEVLKDISFTIAAGDIFALLGTNGAGKTTTLECIEGLRKYDSGKIQVKGTCGVQLQSSSLPANMKVSEAVKFFGKWQKTKGNPELIQSLGVDAFWNKQYTQLSTGQKRRLHLMIALLGEPDIIVLDEPTAGLDVEGRAGIHEEIRKLKSRGKTILLASHDMAEVEELCSQIAILHQGKLAFLGTVTELKNSKAESVTLYLQFSAVPKINQLQNSLDWQQEGKNITVQTNCIEKTLGEVIACIQMQDISIRDVRVEQVGIEQRFLEIAREDRK